MSQASARDRRHREKIYARCRLLVARRDAEIRAAWKRPPWWLWFADRIQAGSTARWLQLRQERHEAMLKIAYKDLVRQALNA